MALLLLSGLLLLPVFTGWGALTEKLTGSFTKGIAGLAFTGIMTICTLWMATAFFLPLSVFVEIPVIVTGLFFFFRNNTCKRVMQFSVQEYRIFFFALCIILFCASFYPYILDHFGYYIPTIKWLTEYGLVKGVSNLDLTLGQMSVWHLFQAGFSHLSDPFLRINAVLLIVYLIYIIENRSWIQLLFIPVLLLFSQSPSPDLPVIIFSLFITNEMLQRNTHTLLLFAFSAFVFTIKPTMIWLPLACFLYTLLIIRKNFITLIPGAAIVMLFFIKNIYTFGYPVFPLSMGDLKVSWKPDPEILAISSRYAILKTYDMQYSYEEIQRFSGWDFIKNWLFLKGIKSKINILFILSLLFFTGYVIRKKEKMFTIILISLLIKSFLVLIFSAQYRFFIDVFFIIAFMVLRNYCSRKTSITAFSVMGIALAGILLAPGILQTYLPSFRLGSFMGKFEAGQWYKPSEYRYHRYNTYTVGNFRFNVSEEYPYSFDTPLPAVSESYLFEEVEAGIFPQIIDPADIRKGFVRKKLDPAEQKQADSVVRAVK